MTLLKDEPKDPRRRGDECTVSTNSHPHVAKAIAPSVRENLRLPRLVLDYRVSSEVTDGLLRHTVNAILKLMV